MDSYSWLNQRWQISKTYIHQRCEDTKYCLEAYQKLWLIGIDNLRKEKDKEKDRDRDRQTE